MSVKYSRIPTDDCESGLTFDYSSPFSYDQDYSYKYRSAFKYSTNKDRQIYSNLDTESLQSTRSGLICHIFLSGVFILLLILTFPISIWFSFKMLPNFQKVVVFRLGKLIGAKGPGMVFVIPCIDRLHKVDVRIKAFNVPPKQIIIGDGAVIEVGADVHYRIRDVEKSITCVQNLDQSTRILVQTALLKLLVRKNLAEIETQRNALGKSVQETSNETCAAWGVEICRIELSQVKVLRGPPAKSAPTMMFPPGMMPPGASSSNLPPAIQQLASALLTAQGNGAVPVEQQAAPQSSTSLGSSENMTAADILQAVQAVLTESLVQKVDAIIQFQITGDTGGLYYLDLKHGKGSAGEGMAPNGESDATLMMSLDDLQAMFTGQIKPFQAYMTGRLEAAGDLDAAMRLEEVIKKITGKS
ncbi:hypothetical protein SNE40_018852 [Patella caerulea]|uniref:Band 7 domain-containing protein n=1 Tax=Patella caerulea TaxID=87958 RepID=A0AAN8J5R8_PATCE